MSARQLNLSNAVALFTGARDRSRPGSAPLEWIMKLFECQNCGHALYFENTRCESCGLHLGFLPAGQVITACSRRADNGSTSR
jgi:hypothetical protein